MLIHLYDWSASEVDPVDPGPRYLSLLGGFCVWVWEERDCTSGIDMKKQFGMK